MDTMAGMQNLDRWPSWLRVAALAVFTVVGVQHLWHTRTASARHRVWHGGHATMAAGMVAMYWPAAQPPIPDSLGATLFLTAAAIFLTLATRAETPGHTRHVRALNPLWAAAAVEMTAMAYMYVMASQTPIITDVFVAYFLAQTVAWARDWWNGHQLAAPSTQVTDLNHGSKPRWGAPPTPTVLAPNPPAAWPPALRVGLATMALGMAATLLIM